MSLRTSTFLLAAALCTAWVIAQPAATDEKTRQGVYVRDSAVAGEKLALAQRMERLKEWDKSADVYQEIVEKYADRVVPISGEGAEKRYGSVTLAVQDLLGKWPEDGLTAYRAKYETPAATLLEAAGPDDAAALSRIVQLYFPTDAAKSAALRLIELNIETGELAAASWLGERLLLHHPMLGNDRPRLLFRTALAEHLADNGTAAKSHLEELKAKFATAVGMLGGKEANFAAELEKLLALPVAVVHGTSADSWPIVGGDASRSRIPAAGGRPGAKLVNIPFIRPRQLINPEFRGQLDNLEKSNRDYGLSLCIVPVVDRDELFYQDNSRVYAKGMDGGLTLPGWTTTYGDESKSRFAAGGLAMPSNAQLTVTATDHAVLAVLGQYDQAPTMNEAGVPMAAQANTRLVCLDRATGALRWSISPSQFPESMGNLKELDLGGSPLVIGDNVYVAARGGKPMQFEDAYVLCFNLADGKLRWSCYLASGNAPDANYSGNPMPSTGISHLAYAGGRLYSVTNIGAVAAIDAYAGTIVWLNLYPRPTINQSMPQIPMQMAANARKPWGLNPAIVKDGRVFCLPSDGQHILIYDAANGDEIKRIPVAPYDSADALLGVTSDKLVVSGRYKVYCINWPAFDPAKKASDSIHWYSTLAVNGPSDKNIDTVRGRGFITSDSVFIATTTSLRRIQMSNGAVAETYPRDGTWGAGEGPGNVLVTQNQVIIAGADQISIYSDLNLARAKLDKAVQDSPQAPLPRLKYAETLFAAGQLPQAVEKLDEAIQLLGGVGQMRPGPDRDGAFARSLVFAERAANPKVGAGDVALANTLYDRAGAAAFSPTQNVSYRISRARFARTKQDFPTEVRLFQEILSDGKFRDVVIPAEDGQSTVAAGAFAEAQLAQRIKDVPAAYKPFEEAAAKELAAAKAAGDAPRMLKIAQAYPNAQVAPEALLSAGAVYEAAANHRAATQVLKLAYRKYTNESYKTRVTEALARNYLHLPNGVGIAIARLREGAKSPGGKALTQPLSLPDGGTIENVSFGAAAEMLQRYSARVDSASLPDFKIFTSSKKRVPGFLPEDNNTIINDVDMIVTAPSQSPQLARNDRIVTWSQQKGLSVYAVGTNSPLGTNPAITQRPLGAAWIGQELLVWTASSVALLRGEGNANNWETTTKSLPGVDVLEGGDQIIRGDPNAGLPRGVVVGPGMIVVDNQVINLGRQRVIRNGNRLVVGGVAPRVPRGPQQGEQIEHVLPVGDRVIFATSTGRIVSLDLTNGQVAWQTRLGTSRLDQLLASDDFVVARFTDEANAQLVALDTLAGQVVTRLNFSINNGSTVMNAALSPDGTLVYTLPDRVCGKDLYEPGKDLKFGKNPTSPQGDRFFDGAIGPGQLLIAEGRVFAVCDGGKFVRILSLENGAEVGNPRNTYSNDWRVWMSVVGSRLYIVNSEAAHGYSIDGEDKWQGGVDGRPTVRVGFVGKRHIVLLDQPTPPGEEPAKSSPRFRLLAYSRKETTPGKESGLLEQVEQVIHPIGIDQFQPVEGGFYYRSTDGKAHFRKGAAP